MIGYGKITHLFVSVSGDPENAEQTLLPRRILLSPHPANVVPDTGTVKFRSPVAGLAKQHDATVSKAAKALSERQIVAIRQRFGGGGDDLGYGLFALP
ncbi:hypothetical protein LJR231_002769 [Phyllobacterium sp. LjRoot231]|uniref:hypothetical protein n=1 Tax=Phyllobacterium sp. LjRoot231 TaxID=3342289 RepID=UPI003ECF883D